MADNNNNPHTEAFGRVIEMLGQARTFAAEELHLPAHNFIRTQIDADIRRIQNKLQMLAGAELADAAIKPVVGTDTAELEPVTHILGQRVNFRKPVEAASTVIASDDKEQFLSRRNALLEQIPILTDEEILAAIKTPGAEPVIRNIARKAGLEDYREAAIDIDFVTNIRKGLEAQKYQQGVVDAADKGAAQLQADKNIEGQTLPEGLSALYPDQNIVTEEVSGLPNITAQEQPPAAAPTPAQAPKEPEEAKTEAPKQNNSRSRRS